MESVKVLKSIKNQIKEKMKAFKMIINEVGYFGQNEKNAIVIFLIIDKNIEYSIMREIIHLIFHKLLEAQDLNQMDL